MSSWLWSWSRSWAAAAALLVVAAAGATLFAVLRGRWSGLRAGPRDWNSCAGCGRRAGLKECTGCRINRYCSDGCQTRDWGRHRAFCKYMRGCRKTTEHDAMVLPADGGPVRLRRLAFSTDAATFPSALFLRAPDLRAFFGAELPNVRFHRIQAADQPDPADNGEYIMYYVMAPPLPPNERLMHLLRLDDLPDDRPFWHGDVVIVKTDDKFLRRPVELREFGGIAPEVDYLDVRMSFAPGMHKWMQQFYHVGFFEALKNNDLFEQLKNQDQAALRRRGTAKPDEADRE